MQPGADSASNDPRDAFGAHDYAMSLSIQNVVRELCDLLGATTVAVIGGVQETRAVQQWMADREPQRADELRFALQLAAMISTYQNRAVARAWFRGVNPRLDDHMPMLMLRDLPLSEVHAPLLNAARAFAARDAAPDGHT